MLIPNEDNIKTVTDIRENIIKILAAIKKREEPTFIFHRSRPEGILMSVASYNKLQELLEDYADALDALRLERSPEKGGQTLEQVAKELDIKTKKAK